MPSPVKPTPVPSQPNYSNPQAGRALLDTLLPRGISARKAWADNILASFSQLKIPYAPQYFCAVLAVAEQESGFNPDPEVPNLSAIVWQQIDEHRKKYMIPQFVIDAAMLKKSPDGRSYKERVNALRTKRQMNQLYEDMVRELPYGQDLMLSKNPIRDGGPMQVSVAFAQTQIKAWPYPYSYTNLRDEVFSLRGSVYFGTAILLQYAAPYDQMIYRFADYNAGRYSSRNAAFQAAVARLTGRKLSLDGDLMLYSNKMNRVFSGQASETQQALMTQSGRLQMSSADILRDLKQEKLSSFEQTTLYQRVFAAADRQAGRRVARETMPQIVLISPKFTHKLTTEWFATRVNGRYRQCMARGGFKAE
ncbi:uncharacterized protein DUF1615 [Paludibacterium purpuratum]|uniref:Uncharacterized protein DUF1615 n=2 Tax=Paludibacterium purpuratum TaxID=1144873 RepID=A0A4R7B226_9NEIS|nr:uncharacterized protein DUF1615 [Paludibacterium purpuratum]